MAAAVVHYIKHWDNNTKGYIEFGDVVSLQDAVDQTQRKLEDEILDGDVLGQFADLFTITKAEIVDSVQNYSGHRSSL